MKMKDIDIQLEKLSPKEGDVILVRANISYQSDADIDYICSIFENLSGALGQRDIHLVFYDKDTEIQKLSEDELRELGLQRIDKDVEGFTSGE